MGKKNKNTKPESTDSKTGLQQQQQSLNPNQSSQQSGGQQQQQGGRQRQQGAGDQQPSGQQRQQAGGDPKGAWGEQRQQQGGQQQSGRQRQQGAGDQQPGGHQRQQGAGGPKESWGQRQQQGGRQRQQGEGNQQPSGQQRQQAAGAPQGAWDQQRQQQGGQQQPGSQQRQKSAGDQQPSGQQRQQAAGAPQGAWDQQRQQQGGQQQPGSQQRQKSAGAQQPSDQQQQQAAGAPQGAWGQQRQQQGGRQRQQGAGNQQPSGQQQQQAAGAPQGAWDQQRQQQGGQQQPSGRQRQQGAGDQQSGGHQRQQAAGGPQGAWDQQRQQQGGRQRQQGAGNQQPSGQQRQQAAGAPQGAWDQQRQQQSGQERRATGGGQQVPQPQSGQQRTSGGWNKDQQGRGRYPQQERSETLIGKMEALSIKSEPVLPVKEKSCNNIVRGTLGKPGTVEVNYVTLNLDNMPNEAYHYDVTIIPDRPKKFLRVAFEQFRLEVFPDVVMAFDGVKSCYSIQSLNAPVQRKIEVPDSNNRMKEFQVEIKETDTCIVDMRSLRNYQTERVFDKPMRALQVLEVVLASNNYERGVRVGRSFFRRPDNPYDLTDGFEAWTGLYQAAILGELPLLNVDIAHKSFPRESTLIDYLKEMNINTNQDLSRFGGVCSFLRGINIRYTPPECFGASPREYKVLGVGEPASRKTFKTDDGKQLTIAEYFRSRGYTLLYPNLNCLSVGSTVKQISLPMELCSIPSGQALNRKDQSRQVEKMVRYAATSTNDRKRKIMELLRYFDHNVNPIIRAFGLAIGSNFLKVPFRLLPSPYMEYFQGQTVTTFKGAWRMDNLKYLSCSKPQSGVHKWAILYEDNARISYHELETFKSSVIKTSQSLNMNLQNTAEIKSYNFRQLSVMLKQLACDKYDLVFVVLSDRGTPYSKIKQVAELEVGILTQCIKDRTVFRTGRDKTVFSNILLKVNGKLNGTNHKIAQDRDSNLLSPIKNVMYLGADVTHPSPDQRHIPSVVGVAASHDLYGACYNCQYRLQRSTVENIEDMESIVIRHLQVYKTYLKRYPELIIYYRDGVSDGQFPIVEREEVRAIRRACNKMGCNPKLTCVIVVKRHHTRFFPLTQPQNEKDFNNVQAGTVVDQHITHPNEIQFFMVSHQSIQGTARPTRYNVILDESKFDINLLQKLTYNLCHLFPRCNRAVSYPAPAYLAHLVAFRGRVYLEGTQKFGNLKTEYERRQINHDFLNRNPMYFI